MYVFLLKYPFIHLNTCKVFQLHICFKFNFASCDWQFRKLAILNQNIKLSKKAKVSFTCLKKHTRGYV